MTDISVRDDITGIRERLKKLAGEFSDYVVKTKYIFGDTASDPIARSETALGPGNFATKNPNTARGRMKERQREREPTVG